MKKPSTPSRTTYILLIEKSFMGAYASKEAMFIDAGEFLYGHVEPLRRRWNGEKPYKRGNIEVVKSENVTTAWAKYYNWADQLPPDTGEEHFESVKNT